jgi:hypothetical protein
MSMIMSYNEEQKSLTSFHSSVVFTTRIPARRSECPPKYFVALCITQSAPHLKGYCSGGGPKVASTTSLPPTAWILSA